MYAMEVSERTLTVGARQTFCLYTLKLQLMLDSLRMRRAWKRYRRHAVIAQRAWDSLEDFCRCLPSPEHRTDRQEFLIGLFEQETDKYANSRYASKKSVITAIQAQRKTEIRLRLCRHGVV